MSITPVQGNSYWNMSSAKKQSRPTATDFLSFIAEESAKTDTAAPSAAPSVEFYIEQARQHYQAQADTAQGEDDSAYTPYFIPRTTPLPEGVAPVADDAEPELFQGRKVIGHMDGLPVTEETPEEEAAAIAELTEKSLARGQKKEELVFIKGNVPIWQEPVGPLLGHHLTTAVLITQKLTPVQDPVLIEQLRRNLHVAA